MSTPNEPEKKPSEAGSGQIVPPWQRGVTETGGGGGSQTVTTPVTKPAAKAPVDGRPADSKPVDSKSADHPAEQNHAGQNRGSTTRTPDSKAPDSKGGGSPIGDDSATDTVAKPSGSAPSTTAAGGAQAPSTGTAAKPAATRPLITGTAAPKLSGGPQPSEVSAEAKRDAAAAKAALAGTGAPTKFKESPTRNIPRDAINTESLPDLDAIHNVPDEATSVTASTRSAPAKVGASRPVRASMQLRSVDPWSVFKIGAVLSTVGFLIWMIAIAVLYLVLEGMGVWDQLNSSFGTLVTADGGTGAGEIIGAGAVFGWGALLGAVSAILLTAIATVGSYIYNVCADLVGGVEVTLADLD